jgi:hypothetical protein
MTYVLVQGNIETGFHIIGPFPTRESASTWATKYGDADRETYRILPIENPDVDPC